MAVATDSVDAVGEGAAAISAAVGALAGEALAGEALAALAAVAASSWISASSRFRYSSFFSSACESRFRGEGRGQ